VRTTRQPGLRHLDAALGGGLWVPETLQRLRDLRIFVEQAAEAARRKGLDEDTVAERAATAAREAVPKPKAQRNFTDPDSRIMKTSDGSFRQCYNAQAVVDADHQVIVATDLNQSAADVTNLIPMTEQAATNTGQAPGQVLADAGYCSDTNLEQAAEISERTGNAFVIATGGQRHDEPVPATPRGRIPKDATRRQRMARKLRTKPGHAAYSRRKAIVEPVFGQMAACHNLRKLHGHIGTHGLTHLATA
jgi:hypothetical protein